MYPVKAYNCRCKVVAYFPNHSKDRGTEKSVESYNKWLEEKNGYFLSNGHTSNTRLELQAEKVEYIKPSYLPISERNEDKIINKISSHDKTNGSCSSVAFAYIGNKAGLNVTDFRGGISQNIFSKIDNIREIANIKGVDGAVLKSKNDYKSYNRIKATLEDGKEYYLGVGQHASIIKKDNDSIKYLELQDDIGQWYELDDKALKERFLCSKKRTIESYSIIIDIESLFDKSEFETLLGYLNTNKE